MNLNVTQYCPICSLIYQSCRRAVCYVDLALPQTKNFNIRSVHITQEEFEIGDLTLRKHQKFSVHTTQEEFKIRDLTLKTHQKFSVHTTQDEFKNAAITRGGTPIYGLYRYVPRNRVWFSRFSVLK